MIKHQITYLNDKNKPIQESSWQNTWILTLIFQRIDPIIT